MSTSVSDAAPPAGDPSGEQPPGGEPSGKAPTLRGRIGLVLVGVLVVLAAGGFGIIAGFARPSPGIVAQTIAFKITDTSVRISYSVAKPEDERVRCTLDAFDPAFEILAEKTIVVPAGKTGIKGTETLRTTRRATGARIHDCERI